MGSDMQRSLGTNFLRTIAWSGASSEATRDIMFKGSGHSKAMKCTAKRSRGPSKVYQAPRRKMFSNVASHRPLTEDAQKAERRS